MLPSGEMPIGSPSGVSIGAIVHVSADAAAFSKKALPYGLILVPSDSFGVPGYFRIAFCTDTEKVVRSIDAFKKFVKAEYR